MGSKMLLFCLNGFVLLAIVTGDRRRDTGSIIFEDSPKFKSDGSLRPNQTVLQSTLPVLPQKHQQSPPQGGVQQPKPLQSQPQAVMQPPKPQAAVQAVKPYQPLPQAAVQTPVYYHQSQPQITFQPTQPQSVKPLESIETPNKLNFQHYIQPIPVWTPSRDDRKEMWVIGLLNAALNIDKSLDSINTLDPKSEHNIVVSPLCIAAAMALILLGSNGVTKTEIQKLFNFDEENPLLSTDNYNNFEELGMLLSYFEGNGTDNTKPGTHINLAKAIFVQKDYNILNNYKQIAKNSLHTELITVDFKSNGLHAQQSINQWVSNQTHGKIDFIMPDIPLPTTKTVITSALYFIGEWEYPFFVNYTRIKPFYLGSNSEGKKTAKQSKEYVYVPMMVGNSEVLYHKNDKLGFKAIGLHYKEKKFVMYFLLPNSNIDLRDVVSKMNGTTLRSITKDTKITDFTYLVPKMTLDSFTNLRPVLQNLGINKVFDPLEADLSNMGTESKPYISDILHKVQIDINEFGTVASAATVVTITRGGHGTFNLNKPFIFFIHCVETDTTVFWGTVYKPTPYSTVMPTISTNLHRRL